MQVAVLGVVWNHHVGQPGASASAKLVANSTLIGTIAVLSEELRLADRLGLD